MLPLQTYAGQHFKETKAKQIKVKQKKQNTKNKNP